MKKHQGFTLIELVLYIGIVSIILTTVTSLLIAIFSARSKSQTVSEVEQNGNVAIQIISQVLRNATSINTPTQGNSGSSLSINVTDSAKSPTVFDISNGVLRITEGTSQPVNLTSNRITVSNLTVKNLSAGSSFQTAKVNFTVSYINPSGRNEYTYQENFYFSGTLKK